MIIVQSVLKVWDSYCQDKIIFFFSEYCWSVPMFHLYGKIAWCAPLSPLLQTVLFQLHSGKWQRDLRMLLRIVVPKLWVATLVGHETKRKDCYAHQGVKNLKGAPLPNHHYSLALGYILGILGYIWITCDLALSYWVFPIILLVLLIYVLYQNITKVGQGCLSLLLIFFTKKHLLGFWRTPGCPGIQFKNSMHFQSLLGPVIFQNFVTCFLLRIGICM